MVGRGVLLDIARFRGVPWMKDGEGISNDELDKCAKAQGVDIRKGDFVHVRTGQMERCMSEGVWGGYAGGDAPGVMFENCYWCQEKQIGALCMDTWGCEVRPNETTEANQPWHWVVIPAMGLCMGEIFYLKELAEDCAQDKVYEFFFSGPPLIITGGTGSPINPQAIEITTHAKPSPFVHDFPARSPLWHVPARFLDGMHDRSGSLRCGPFLQRGRNLHSSAHYFRQNGVRPKRHAMSPRRRTATPIARNGPTGALSASAPTRMISPRASRSARIPGLASDSRSNVRRC